MFCSECQSVGRQLGDWHDGQGDPIYAVGSTLRAGRIPNDPELVEDAARNLRRTKRRPAIILANKLERLAKGWF